MQHLQAIRCARPAVLSRPVPDADEPELWAIQVHDPEDIWAMPSKQIAEFTASAQQKMLDLIAEKHRIPLSDTKVIAVRWPYDAASHAEALLRGEGTLFADASTLH